MKIAKNTNYLHINNKTENINAPKGVEITSSKDAWKKHAWCRKYFNKLPKEGYFIHVKKEIKLPISTCALLNMKDAKQKMQNLLIIESGICAKAVGFCASEKANLCGSHNAEGKIILKNDASLDYLHTHAWGEKDMVETDYEFILEKGASLKYKYNAKKTPQELNIKNKITLKEKANANIELKLNSSKTKTKIYDELNLEGKNSSGETKIRIVAGEKSDIESISKVNALAESRGHLDCTGLLTREGSKISLIPELNCENKNAELTHEASVGKINDEALHYLQTRGIRKSKATEIIKKGFLNS